MMLLSGNHPFNPIVIEIAVSQRLSNLCLLVMESPSSSCAHESLTGVNCHFQVYLAVRYGHMTTVRPRGI